MFNLLICVHKSKKIIKMEHNEYFTWLYPLLNISI